MNQNESIREALAYLFENYAPTLVGQEQKFADSLGGLNYASALAEALRIVRDSGATLTEEESLAFLAKFATHHTD